MADRDEILSRLQELEEQQATTAAKVASLERTTAEQEASLNEMDILMNGVLEATTNMNSDLQAMARSQNRNAQVRSGSHGPATRMQRSRRFRPYDAPEQSVAPTHGPSYLRSGRRY